MPKAPPALRTHPLAPTSRGHGIHAKHRWRKHSERMRRKYPLCMAPFCHRKAQGNWPQATSVHHIRGLERHPELAYVEANTCPVCSKCHAHVESQERAGKPTQHLFKNWQGAIDGEA